MYPSVHVCHYSMYLCSWHIAAKFLFVDDEEAALVSGVCVPVCPVCGIQTCSKSSMVWLPIDTGSCLYLPLMADGPV